MLKRLFISLLFIGFLLVFHSAVLAKTADNSIKVFKLNNGHTIVIKEVHTNPIVTIDTWIKTGSINEDDKNNGVSHFLEHLLFKGTKRHKNGEIDKILESKGAKFNAATSKDFTHYYITIASQYFDTALDLHSDMLLNATFPPDGVDRERKVVQEEIRRSKDNPGSILFDNMNEILFKKHPYKYDTLGTPEIIGSIPREEIIKYYQKWYIPSNMITVVVGDINTEKALALVKEKFQSDRNHNKIKPSYQREPFIQKSEEKVKNGSYNKAYLEIGFKCVPIWNKKDNYALDLAASILGDGRSSRLYQSLKEKNNLVSSIGAGHFSMKDDSIFYISSNLEPRYYNLAKQAIVKEINRLKNGNITDEELQRAKTLLQRQFLYSSESVEDIANTIGYSMVISGKLDYYTNYIDDIKKISKADIQNAMKKYIIDSRMAVSALMPQKKDEIKAETDVSFKNIVKSKLDNGMTFIADKNNSNDIVGMSIFVRGGELNDPVAGMSDLIAGTLMKGTVNKTALEIANELESSGIIISPSANPDYFEIQLKSTKADFDKALDILTDIIKNPAFKQQDIDIVKNDIIKNIQGSRDTPVSYVMEKFTREMYPDHPYGNIGEVVEKTLPTISRDSMISYYKNTFIPDNMVVSVSGNIDMTSLKEKLNAVFPKTKGKKVEINNHLTQYKPLNKNKLVTINQDTNAAWLVMGWPVSGIASDKEFASLKVINALLGNGLSSRLFVNLREKQSLGYEVSSVYPTRFDNSFFMLYIGTDPKNIEKVKSNFLKEIERLKSEPLSEQELNEIKQRIIGQFALSHETNQEKAHYLGFFEVLGKGFKYDFDFPDSINSVSSDDIIKTANKYFNSPYIISVIAPKQNVVGLEKEYISESKR